MCVSVNIWFISFIYIFFFLCLILTTPLPHTHTHAHRARAETVHHSDMIQSLSNNNDQVEASFVGRWSIRGSLGFNSCRCTPNTHYKDAISSQSAQINGRTSLPVFLQRSAAPPAGWMDGSHAGTADPQPRLFNRRVYDTRVRDTTKCNKQSTQRKTPCWLFHGFGLMCKRQPTLECFQKCRWVNFTVFSF